MKNLPVFLSMLFLFSVSLLSQSQIAQGVYRLSGTVGFNYSTQENNFNPYKYKTTVNQFTLSPGYSVLVTDNFEIGGLFSYTYSAYKYEMTYNNYSGHSTTQTSNRYFRSVSIGPLARYYVRANSVLFFGEFVFQYRDMGEQNGSSNSSSVISLAAGLDIFLSESVSIEPVIRYSMLDYKGEESSENTLSIGAGINYYILPR